eukprot:649104-Amphidinium_carterae.1
MEHVSQTTHSNTSMQCTVGTKNCTTATAPKLQNHTNRNDFFFQASRRFVLVRCTLGNPENRPDATWSRCNQKRCGSAAQEEVQLDLLDGKDINRVAQAIV